MKKMMRSAIVTLASAALLAGCGGADDSGSDGEGLPDVQTGASVPVDLPAGFLLYPGAKVISNTVIGQGDDKGAILMMESEAKVQEMINFYREKAEAANIAVTMDVATKTGKIIGGERADGLSFSFSAQKAGDVALGQLSIGKSSPASTAEETPAGAEDAPEGETAKE